MKRFSLITLLILLTLVSLPTQIHAENSFNIYMDDFYSKSNEANKILKDIEKNLKEGSREKVCTRQREAARLGIIANTSLVKAYKTIGEEPPIEVINASKNRWESLLNKC